MSINSLDTRQSFDALVPPQPKGAPATGGAAFEGALAEAAKHGDGKLLPAVAAEILKVKMLGSALALGAEESSGSATAGSTQRILDTFLAHLAEGAQGGAGGTGGTGVPAGEVGGELAGDAVAAPATPVDTPVGTALAGEAAGSEEIIEKASRRYGVDRHLIRAVIKAESGFNPQAVSSAGARGLMQLMPATAKSLGVRDSFDPEQNVMAGTRFLKDLLQRYGGDVDSALAAYNWGPGNLERSSGGLPRETREYLRKVKGYWAQYSA